jgi:hypothetical protein
MRFTVHPEQDASDTTEVEAESPSRAASVAAKRMPDRFSRFAVVPEGLKDKVSISDTSLGAVFVMEHGGATMRFFVLSDLNSGGMKVFELE